MNHQKGVVHSAKYMLLGTCRQSGRGITVTSRVGLGLGLESGLLNGIVEALLTGRDKLTGGSAR